MSSDARAVVAGHGGFAEGLISAVDQITGRGAFFVAVSNRDLGAAEIEQALRDHIAAGVRVLFTDLPAGSVTIAARRVLRDHPDVTLVTGTSVAVLLDFAFAADVVEAAAAHAAEKGRQALAIYGAGGQPGTTPGTAPGTAPGGARAH